MIKSKDVIRMLVPYPDSNSELYRVSHMYICRDSYGDTYHFFKCQTAKPYLIGILRHYWDEVPDSSRNPFKKTTRIDCDKIFEVSYVFFDDNLKTDIRTDVCDDVMFHIEQELNADGYYIEMIDSKELVTGNSLIHLTNSFST